MTNVYTDILGVTNGTTPAATPGAIGPSFFTPEQADFMKARRRFAGPDDPNVGSYHLSRVHFNKETGTGSFTTTQPLADGWYDQGPGEGCDCPDKGGCSCS